MDRILVAVIGIPLGMAIMIYRYPIIKLFGKVSWAEEKLGGGGSFTLVILFGLAIWVISLMYALGTFQEITVGIFGGLFGLR